MILGFGTGEEQEAKRIIRECSDAIIATPDSPETAVKHVSARYAEAERANKLLGCDEAPERYTYFYANVFEPYSGRTVVEFTMHHINRRHPLSPDGWALLVTHWVLIVGDETRIYKEV